MLGLLWRVFQRYRSLNEVVKGPVGPLIDGRGARIGHIRRYIRKSHAFTVEVWLSEGELVPLDESQWVAPSRGAPDLAAQTTAGFTVTQRVTTGGPSLQVITATQKTVVYLEPPGVPARAHAAVTSAVAFVKLLASASPLALRWWRQKRPSDRQALVRHFGFRREQGPPVAFEPAYFEAAPADLAYAGPPVQIILPVYNGFEVLRETLARVARHTDGPWVCHLIDDASPDPRIADLLRDWATSQGAQVILTTNRENQGFVRTVNAAFGRLTHPSAPVILLNADAWVGAHWASRLIAPLVRDAQIASATPMSNNAEILSVPAMCEAADLAPGELDALNAAAKEMGHTGDWIDIPTGVGFCMAMSPRWIDEIGTFDICFGTGYGEEVDWCQRARRRGGRHVAVPGTFVEHRGSESFGADRRDAQVAAAAKILSQRYPQFDAEVQEFIARDPLATPRLRLALSLAGQRAQTVPIYLAHSMGGGAEVVLRRRIEADLEDGQPSVVLRVGGAARWQIEVFITAGATPTRVSTDDFDLIRRALDVLPRRNIIYSCGVGDRDPISIPGALLQLKRAQDGLSVHFHDFFPLSPSYTLLDGTGRYSGVPEAGTNDRIHWMQRPDGQWADLRAWRAEWGALLRAADELRVFSDDSAGQVLSAYPDVGTPLQVVPHEGFVTHRANAGDADPAVVGVLGNIGPQKGAEVVVALSQLDPEITGVRFVLLGDLCLLYTSPSPRDS